MRVLLDTNIIIHREASTVVKKEIGVLFNWLDRLHYEKCIHALTVAEIQRHKDRKLVATFNAKLQSYSELKTEAPESAAIKKIREADKTDNDRNDTSVLKEVHSRRVDFLITEDRGIHGKAHSGSPGSRPAQTQSGAWIAAGEPGHAPVCRQFPARQRTGDHGQAGVIRLASGRGRPRRRRRRSQ